jgi:trehalose 6-phosphate phosphatase
MELKRMVLLETIHMSKANIEKVDIQTVLSQRPLGLVLDIDGTLSPIAPTPGEARLYPGVASLLEQAREHAHVAIITGRALDDGAAIVNVDDITYIGSHGLEWSDGLLASHPVRVAPEGFAYLNPGRALLDLAERELATLPGIIVERKRIGGTIHYRLCPDPEQARRAILHLLEEPARRVNMRLDEEKRAIEVRTPLDINKGQALLWFMLRFGLQGILFAGDDHTDLDAVLEIERLRQHGMDALAIVVQHNDTPPELLAHADITVGGVEGMVELLRKIVVSLQAFER